MQSSDNVGPSDAEARDALARVIASDAFVASARLQQFLSYVVEEALAGRDNAIRAKAIAAEVYNRDLDDFEGGQNLVRVEARRLRRHLAEYYAGPGKSDPWHICIDLGGYAPRFESAGPEGLSAPASLPTATSPYRNHIILAASALVLVLLVIVVTVVSRTGPAESSASADGAARTALRMRSVPALQAVNLAEQARGMFFPLFDTKRQDLALEMFRHSVRLDPGLHHGYAGAAQVLATLALFAADSAAATAFLDDANRMAKTALELSPEDAWAHGANAWVLVVSGDPDEAMAEARLAVELAPQDGHLLDLAGVTAVLANAPEFAAETANPIRPRTGVGRFGVNNIWGVSHYMLGNYNVTIEAFTGAPESGAPVSAPSLVFLAVAYDHIGNVEEAERLVEEFRETWADFPTNLILSRIFQNEPAFERDILERLSKHAIRKTDEHRPPVRGTPGDMRLEQCSLALAGCALLLCNTSIFAQEIEEVLVTAQRRAESIQDIPVAVTAISTDELNELGWNRPTEIAAQVPNMQVSAPYGDVLPLFAIRGISMLDYTPSQASPIGVYMDEGYLGPTFTHGMSMFDLERIEVLRGPQGTLYGKNTTGGAINLITVTPEMDARSSGFLRIGAGNLGMTSFDGAAESALVDGMLSGRVAIKYKRDEGYWDNSNGPTMAQTDFLTGRATLNYEPGDRFGAVFKITAGKSDGRATPPRITATAGPGITVAGRPSNLQRHSGGINRIGATEVDMTMANLKLSYNWDKFSFVSVSNYVEADYLQVTDPDGTTARLLGIDWGADTKAFAQDLRLVSNFDGPLSFIAGVYYGMEDTDTQIVHSDGFNDPAVNPTLTALGIGAAAVDIDLSNHLLVLADALPQFGQVDRRFDVEKESVAIYGNIYFDATDRLRIGLGIRYTDETNTRDYVNYSRLDQSGNGIGSWVPGNLLAPQFNVLGLACILHE